MDLDASKGGSRCEVRALPTEFLSFDIVLQLLIVFDPWWTDRILSNTAGGLRFETLNTDGLSPFVPNDETEAELEDATALLPLAIFLIMIFLGFPLPMAPPPTTKPKQEESVTVKKKKRTDRIVY